MRDVGDRDKKMAEVQAEVEALRARVAELEEEQAEHRRTADALRRERDLLDRIMVTSPVGITVLDREGAITFANVHAEQALGLTRDEITQRTYNAPEWHISDYEGAPLPDEELPFQRVMRTGQPVYGVQHAVDWPQGDRVYLSINASPLFDESGQVDGMVATVEDVTQQERAKAALQESEVKFRRLTEAAFEGIAVTKAGEFIEVSDQFAALFGYPPEEMIGKSAADVISSEVRDKVMAKIHSGYDQPYESLCRRRDGTSFPVEVCGKNFVSHGEQLRVTAIRDITERRQVEEASRRRAKELEALQATVLDITVQRDLPILLETIIERAARLLDAPGGGLYLCEPDRERVRCVVSYNTPSDYRGTVLAFGEGAAGVVAQTGESLVIDDYRSWDKRATVFDQEQPFQSVLATPMIWQGQVIGVIDVFHDRKSQAYAQSDLDLLTLFANHAAIAVQNTRLYEQAQQEIAERGRLEQQVEERREYLERLLACAPDAIITLDANHQVREWNPGAENLFGYSAEEAIGRDLDEMIAAPDSYMFGEAVSFTQRALSGKTVPPTETIRYRKDGTPIDVILSGSPIIILGEVTGTVAVYADITEQKKAEQALRQSEAQYRSTLDALGDAIHVVGRDLRFVLSNESLRKWNEELGLETDIVGKRLGEVFPFLPPEVCGEYEQVFEAGQFLSTQERTEVGGVEFVTETRKIPIFRDGQVTQVITVIRDVTERKRAEEERELKARQQAALFKISADLVATLDQAEICNRVVEGLHGTLGYDYVSLFLVDEATGDCMLGACIGWPDAPSDFRLRPGRGLGEQPLLDSQLHYTPDLTADPRYIPGIDGKSEVDVPLHSGDKLLGVLVVESKQANDYGYDDFAILTVAANQAAVALERAKEHQAVKLAEIRYQSLFDHTPVGLYRSTPAGELLEVNPTMVEMLGYPDRESLMAVNTADLYLHDDERQKWLTLLDREDVVTGYEARFRQCDGTVIWARDRARAVRDDQGRMLYYEGSMENITEQKQAEEALRESEVKFRNIVESSPMGMHMYQLEPDGRLVFSGANPAADRILGVENSQFIGRTIEEVFPNLRHTEVPDQYRTAASTGRTWRSDQISYQEGRISGVFEVHAFQTSPGKMTAAFLDVTDRRRAEEEIRELKEFNEGIVQNMVEGIAVQDADACITFVNPAAATLLGYTPEELEGLHWTAVVPPDQHWIVQAADERRLTGQSDRYEVELVGKEGTRFPVLISGSPRLDPETGAFVGTLAVFTDIGERVQTEEKLTRHAQEMAALYETSLEINSQRDLSALLSAIVERASKLLGARMGGLYLVQPGGRTLELVVTYNLGESYLGTTLQIGEGLSGRVVQTGEPQMVDDYSDWEGRAAVYAGGPFRRVLGVPLKVGDRIIGVINVTDDQQAGPFEEDEVRLVSLFADQAAIAVENTRLFEAEARRRREAETLTAATQALSATLDLQRVFELILSELQQVVPYDSATVQQLEGTRLEIIGGHGFPNLEELLGVGFDLTATDNPNQEVVRTQAPLILEDAPAIYEQFRREPHAQAAIRSWLGVPLFFGDRLIGMIALDKQEPGFYTEEHARLAMAFAAQAAIAIENARLFEAEREQHELAEALRQATAAVSSSLDLDQILDQILEQVDRVVPSDSANMMLIDGEHVRAVRWRGYDQLDDEIGLRSATFSVAETPNLLEMQTTGKAMLIADTKTCPGWLHDSTRVRSYAGAPIRVRDEVIGFLNINKETPGFFNQTHADRLQVFANQAGLAIGNARFFRIMEQGKRDWEVTFDAMQDAVVLIDPNRRILRANLAFSTLTEKTFPEIVGAFYSDLLQGEVCTAPVCLLEHTTQSGLPAACLHEYGGRLFEVQATPILDGDVRQAGSPASVIYALHDITERKQAEEEIRRRNRELTLLNRVIAASAASQDIESILTAACRELALALEVPQAAAALFNAERTEGRVVAEYLAEGRPSALGEIIPIEGNPSSEYLLEHKAPLVLDNAQTDPRMAAMRDTARRRGTVSLLLVPLLIEGEVMGSLGVDAIEYRPFSIEEVDMARRVAEQVSSALARTRLEETQRHLTAAVEQAGESIIITDTEGTIVYVNPAFERIAGYDRAEATGRNARILKSGKHDQAFYRDLWQTITAGHVWQGRFINRKKDGSLYTEDSTITPVRDQVGEIVNYVAVNHDVTQIVQLEEQFRQSQKMEALGQLAGGIAHDFNNLLTIIQLSTRMVQRQLLPDDPLWEHVQRIQETGKRASTLTKQLLSFSRREIIEPRLLNLNEVVGDLSRMLKRIIGEDIELVTELGDDLWLTKADPTQVDQVILNLVVNARDAMPQGGTLIIETANAVLDKTYADSHVEVEPGDHVLLAITDTGVGIPEDVQTHIFEPFFTTKERGHGTGLGLAAVFGIVKQNKGHIGFYSRVDIGTTFKVYLPRAEAPSAKAELRALPPLTTGLVRGTETILVVEDEVGVLNLTVQVLQACGYKVLTAGDGPQALVLSRAHEGPIHLLITDVVMPRMYGKELADTLLAERQEMRLLFMSGYPDKAIVQQSAVVPGSGFLSKPFTVEELTQQVRAVLDGRV